jgi:hypothetical protein
MNRILAATAVLLLAACETDASGPQNPVAQVAPPAASGGSEAATSDCPITASKGWSAWIDAMPGPAPRRLIVRGEVVTASGGYQVAFDRSLQLRESFPAQAVATLYVTGRQGTATARAVTHEVRWEWPLSQPVGSLTVRCGDKVLAEIARIQTAY